MPIGDEEWVRLMDANYELMVEAEKAEKTLKFNIGDKIIFTHCKKEYPGEIIRINKKSYSVQFKLEDFVTLPNMGNRYVGEDSAWRTMAPSKIIRLQ